MPCLGWPCSQARGEVRDEGLLEAGLNAFPDLLDHSRLVRLQLHQLFLDALDLSELLLGAGNVADAAAVLQAVGLHFDVAELGEAVQGRLDRLLEARLQRGQHVVGVQVDDREVQLLDQVCLLDHEVALDDLVKANCDDEVGVIDVVMQLVKEIDYAKRLTVVLRLVERKHLLTVDLCQGDLLLR